MNRSLSHLTVLALSFACSSDPATPGTDTSPGSSTTDTSGTNSAGSSQATSTFTATSTAPTTTSSATTSKPAPSSQGNNSSSAPQTSATSTSEDSSSAPAESSSSDDEQSSTNDDASTSSDEGSDSSSASADSSDSQTSSGGGDGECVKGATKGNQVLMIAESFVAASHEITRTIEGLARENGSLAQGESYGDRSEPGTRLTGGGGTTITNQYVQYSGRADVKYVLMDGGGNDCLQAAAQQPASALGAAEALFGEMASSGVEKILYFFYPDPLPPIGNDSLKNCLDGMRPEMKALCDGLTAPECHWIDLREVWDGHPEYTDDGIHPTSAGSKATGEAIWDAMVENCIAQ